MISWQYRLARTIIHLRIYIILLCILISLFFLSVLKDIKIETHLEDFIPEILVIYQDDGDGRFAFKTRYELRDNLYLGVGYHHFWGNPWGSNGEFRNNDQYVCELKYSF